MKELSRATFDFKTLIENDCVYVDKTDMLYRLVRSEFDARSHIGPKRSPHDGIHGRPKQ